MVASFTVAGAGTVGLANYVAKTQRAAIAQAAVAEAAQARLDAQAEADAELSTALTVRQEAADAIALITSTIADSSLEPGALVQAVSLVDAAVADVEAARDDVPDGLSVQEIIARTAELDELRAALAAADQTLAASTASVISAYQTRMLNLATVRHNESIAAVKGAIAAADGLVSEVDGTVLDHATIDVLATATFAALQATEATVGATAQALTDHAAALDQQVSAVESAMKAVQDSHDAWQVEQERIAAEKAAAAKAAAERAAAQQAAATTVAPPAAAARGAEAVAAAEAARWGVPLVWGGTFGHMGMWDGSTIHVGEQMLGASDAQVRAVVRHEAAHALIQRQCGTWAPGITGGYENAEPVTDAYADLFLGGLSWKGYGYNADQANIARAIAGGSC